MAKAQKSRKATRKWALAAMANEVVDGGEPRGHDLPRVLAQELDHQRLAPLLVELAFATPGEQLDKVRFRLCDYASEMAMHYFESPAQKDTVEAFRRFNLLGRVRKAVIHG